MPSEIVMPQMGADMQEGTLLKWLKHPGDHVARGEIIAEIETDKANIEIESFEDGVLQQTLVEEGQVVPVGQVIAIIAKPGESTEAPAPPVAAQSTAPGVRQEAAVAPEAMSAGGAPAGANGLTAPARTPVPTLAGGPAHVLPETSQQERLRVSPVARRIAAELGVDLRQVRGSGPDGRIMRKDVEAYARAGGAAVAAAAPAAATPTGRQAAVAAPPPTHAEGLAARVEPATMPGGAPAQPPRPTAPTPEAPAGMSRMRQAIARRMAQSKREAPHYYVTATIDMTEAMAFREQLNAAGDVKITVNDLIVKACAETLRLHPEFNALFVENGLQRKEQINICIGVALPDGLVAPALLDVGSKSLGAIARESRDLAERARNGALRPAEMSEGTFTISNLGMFGVETLIAIIQPPQTAILGVGAVQERPAVHDGQIVPRQLMQVALSADHRATDGAQGAAFLRDLKELLEHPLRLAL